MHGKAFVCVWAEIHTEFCMPSCLDDMSEKAASVFGGVLTNPSKLVGMEHSIFGCLKLQPVGEHFLKHFA
jgi:hypothetical protein